jgi:predicted esterase
MPYRTGVFRIGLALVGWQVLTAMACGQPQDVKVSRPTRLDWEFAASGFDHDPAADVPADYDSKKQKYQLYVPVRYTTTKAWPLIVFISPTAGPVGWTSVQRTCEKEGILFCSPYKAGNSISAGLRIRIILDMVDDVRRNFRIDPHQTYIGGFSGGGRMSCSIGFALPEVFAGVIPVCGTNPPKSLPYLRHRLVDRVSVALITGEGDFNRSENEQWMAPYLKELDIRSQLWVVPGMGHDIPHANIMSEVVAWLAADLKRRQEDAKARPNLNLKFDEAFRGDAQAERLLAAARGELHDDQRLWQGLAMAQGLMKRWPESAAAATSRELLNEVFGNEARAEILARQRLADDSQSFTAQARGQERIGKIPKAIEIWEALARKHPNSPIAESARAEVLRLQDQKRPPKVERKKRGTK